VKPSSLIGAFAIVIFVFWFLDRTIFMWAWWVGTSIASLLAWFQEECHPITKAKEGRK
jgi:hypothetical protein